MPQEYISLVVKPEYYNLDNLVSALNKGRDEDDQIELLETISKDELHTTLLFGPDCEKAKKEIVRFFAIYGEKIPDDEFVQWAKDKGCFDTNLPLTPASKGLQMFMGMNMPLDHFHADFNKLVTVIDSSGNPVEKNGKVVAAVPKQATDVMRWLDMIHQHLISSGVDKNKTPWVGPKRPVLQTYPSVKVVEGSFLPHFTMAVPEDKPGNDMSKNFPHPDKVVKLSVCDIQVHQNFVHPNGEGEGTVKKRRTWSAREAIWGHGF
jgi:hypothetical protein